MSNKERWGTRVGLVLAMAGNAVGLGNFLRFPAQAAQNGGGAFLIPYLISFLLLGIPLLWVEWAIGRHGGQHGHHAAPGLFDVLGKKKILKYIGVFGIFTNLIIVAYYTYIESWALAYVWHSLVGTFQRLNPDQFFPDYLGATGASVWAFPTQAIFWFLLTMALNVWILSRGLARGIERAAKIGMPLLILFAVVLVIRGLTLEPGQDPGVRQSPLVGLNFVWEPQLSGLMDVGTWLAASGQVFFTLSLGMGSIHCYASYLREKDDIALNAASAGWINEFVEVVLGSSLIIPIATAYLGLQMVAAATSTGSGFSLGFLTLPVLFNHWGWFAPLAGAMWFGLLFFAGITSSLAMGQPVVAFFTDEFRLNKNQAVAIFASVAVVLGLLCVIFYPGGFFDEFDFWSGTLALVVFAFLEVLVFIFVFGIGKGWAEIVKGAQIQVPPFYRFVIQYITPVVLLFILIGAIVEPSDAWGKAIGGLIAGEGWQFAPGSVAGKLGHLDQTEYVWWNEQGFTPVFVKDMARLTMVLIFLGFCFLVHLAWKSKGEK